MAHSQFRQGIPTHLTLEQFEEFVLPHLHIGRPGASTETRAACDFQPYFEAAVSRLSVERTPDGEERGRATGNPLQQNLSCL